MSLIPPSVGTVPPQGNVEQNELATEYRNTVIQIQSQLFERRLPTATWLWLAVMVGGYAGTFTVWGNTRGQLPANANILIALLLGFSLCVFIGYQVYKMAGHVNHFRLVRALLSDGLPLQEFFDKYNKLERQAGKMTLRHGAMASALWFLACVIPAILALGLLFFNFAASLLRFQMWPQWCFAAK